MDAGIRTGRIVGVLLLLLIIGGILTNFVLTAPLFGEPDFLIAAAGYSSQIGMSALLGVAMGLVSVGIAVLIYPVFRQHSQTLGLFYFALAIAGFAVTVVENASVMSMLSLSQSYAKAGAEQQELYQGLRVVVMSARDWTHFIGMTVSSSIMFVFYLSMYRFKFIPRAISIFGLFAVSLHLLAVSMPLFGLDVDFRLIMPIGICEIVLAFWLIVRGFRGKAMMQAVA